MAADEAWDREAVDALIQRVGEISFGTPSNAIGGNPFGGLEGLSVALADRGLDTPVGPALHQIAGTLADGAQAISSSLDGIAGALEALAEAVREAAKDG